MKAERLTAQRVKTLAAIPGEHFDSVVRGLALRVQGSGACWTLRYRLQGRQRRWTIGALDDIPLKEARVRANDGRTRVSKGEDPASDRRVEAARVAGDQAESVAALAELYIQMHAKPFKPKKWAEDQRVLQKDVLPYWGRRPVKSLTRRDVRLRLDQIAARAPIQANRTLEVIRKMLNFAVDREWLDANPAARMAKATPERKRTRLLTEDEIRTFWAVCDTLPPAMAAFWRLRLLTAQRRVEVNDLQWSELNLREGLWTIPGSRTKNGRTHLVPLSAPALEILHAQRAYVSRDGYALQGARGKRQQRQARERFALPDFEGHDLRRTATTLMRKAGVPRPDVAAVLNHTPREGGDALAHYDLYDMFDEKRRALDRWGRVLMGIVAPQEDMEKVVAITR